MSFEEKKQVFQFIEESNITAKEEEEKRNRLYDEELQFISQTINLVS